MDDERIKQTVATVLRASRACGIPISREDVQAALNDAHHGPLFAEWASLHLGKDTLLTTHELQTYTELDQTGRVDQLADSHDLSYVQAVTEEDLRLAIEQLGQSTEDIDKQTETLRQQRDALSRMVKRQAENKARRREMERAQKRSKDVQRAQLTKEVDTITQDISLRLAELELQGPSINHQVSTLLQSDDALLSGLQKLGWELEQPDPDEERAVEKLREICLRLITMTVQTVRARLDTIYLETLVAAENSGAMKPATGQEVTELQEEVESLYSEISSVAQISIEKQYLEPALQSIATKNGRRLSKTVSSLNYITACLSHLQERISRLHAHVESHKSYQLAAEAMTATAKAELAINVSPSTKTTPKNPILISPIRRAPQRSSAAMQEGDDDDDDGDKESALETLLKRLAISLPPEGEASPTARLNALAKIVDQRSRKCDEVAHAAQESLEIVTRAHLTDAKLAVQLLQDSILAESPFGHVNIVDPDIEGSIDVLRQELDKVQGKLHTLEEQGKRIVAGSRAKRDEFVERWGGL
ncbi:hypothetical protein E4U57_001307 [Claviceps arundinis]|uniref:Uncharacterized protein n=1 Tax=Claviceps arundinis TaxID=1623583 RepID=A0ABQ7PAT1_9HYPO|nr:hypothetical protein E4U57_001307 [Claviceps arundinis]